MPPMLRQCVTTAITTVHAASAMFAMAAMLGRLAAQLTRVRHQTTKTPGFCTVASIESMT
jgi:hypothetical protein